MSGPQVSAGGKVEQEERAPGSTGVPDPAEGDTDRPDESEILERVLAKAKGVARDLLDLLRIGYDRARLGARHVQFRLAVLAWVGLAVTTATIVSTYYVVQGLSDLLTVALGNRPWGGRLASGVLVLATIGLAVLVVRSRARRAELRRLEARYADPTRTKDRGESP